MNERLDEFDDAAQEYAGRIAGNDEDAVPRKLLGVEE